MVREYTSAREYLDDIFQHVEKMLARHHRTATATDDDQAAHREIAELGLEVQRFEETMRARCEAAVEVGVDIPLDRLRRSFGLTTSEVAVIEVLGALELASCVRLVAAPYLDAKGAATVELLEALIYRRGRATASSGEELGTDARLFRYQLATLGDAELPWLARPVRIAPRVLELAMGKLRLDSEVARVATLVELPEHGEQLLVDPTKPALVDAALVNQARAANQPIPLVLGPEGSGRGSLVHAGACALQRPVLDVSSHSLPSATDRLLPLLGAIAREATLFGAVLLVRGIESLAGNDERGIADRIHAVVGMLLRASVPVAATALSNVWPHAAARPVVLVELGVPGEADRETLWKRALGPASGEVSGRAAERYRVTPGVILKASDFARVQAAARSGPVVLQDVRVGIRQLLDRDLSTLGRRVEWKQTWDDVVLPDDVREELREMIGRIKYRRRVLDEWGFSRKLAKGVGVSALFAGPPGTGKTMVAGLVAQELELDLYMIDASRMVSKWIGETEKNLARLFDAAGAGHAALLFDEADSLFAKRTEVKSSTDRYANLEVNYLLQRMEAFEGVTILTTNLEASIDEAFKRRLAFRIAFPVPEAEERAQLWKAMLPAQAAVSNDIDFDALAKRYIMTGGYIRNAVLRAAYLAAAENTKISMRHLQRGATLEYTSMGKVIHSSSSTL